MFAGCYIVDRIHQGKGYGLQTWRAVSASFSKSSNTAANAVVEKVPIYGREGFKPYWEQQRFQFVTNDVSNCLMNIRTVTCNYTTFSANILYFASV